MHNSIQKAFHTIVAEEDLKCKTLSAIYAGYRKPVRYSKKMAAVAMSFILLLGCGVLSFRVYNTPAASVSIEINPAMELVINRFDRVLEVYAYNIDGKDIVEDTDFKFQKYDEAVESIVGLLAAKGYLNNPDSLLSVTFETKDQEKERMLLTELTNTAHTVMNQHHCKNQVEVFSVSSEVMGNARSLQISPAKYLAITELQKVDAGATVEGCKHHSVLELRQMAQTRTNVNESSEKTMQYDKGCRKHHHHGSKCN